jgi:peptidoglycan/xylan/chitin deacetylase (PgdA/CDA1 family)
MVTSSISRIAQSAKRLLKSTAPRSLVLMYHRVAEEGIDPWALNVTPENFEAHLQVLQRVAVPTSLKKLVHHHQTQDWLERAVAITFDDGYANNLYNAKPLLERYSIPATVFVTTAYTEQHREFWWDGLEQILLQPGTLPTTLNVLINGSLQKWVLNSASDYSKAQWEQDHCALAWEALSGSRLGFYYTVWQRLQPLTEAERCRILDEIRSWASQVPVVRPTHRPMTAQELHALEQGGLMEVGAHTVHHPLLSSLPIATQQAEIYQSKVYLEHELGHPVHSFAYPFGVYQRETVPLVREVGFGCACSTQEESVWPRSDRFQLPRFEVRNWSGEEFQKRLQQWLHC